MQNPRGSFSIEYRILAKLFGQKRIGARHLGLNEIKKGFEKIQYREVQNTIEKLIKENLIIPKKAHYGLQISLNVKRIREIKEKLALSPD